MIYKHSSRKIDFLLSEISLTVVIQLQEYQICLGHWGGIWTSPKRYKLDSTNMKQEQVILQKKFGKWNYSDSGLQQRLPYIYKHRLTTSHKPHTNFYGSITGRSN